ncbi:hypothetical protein H6501_02575 [Candidatus Woesearchaeota archaeon]|nr:hypothetical protein [Nanoarchaeota archaeon]MCB9370456.1 hypothetical protein [Candidatus Woesearchaeota archaeon]USN43534.1 MAG: hypothetical protein H6500_04015 [Candidatus Woesearchaeota archaeon]
MVEILFNEKLGNYTFKKEIDNVPSVKRVPIKFKAEDSTARFRKEDLRKELLTAKKQPFEDKP